MAGPAPAASSSGVEERSSSSSSGLWELLHAKVVQSQSSRIGNTTAMLDVRRFFEDAAMPQEEYLPTVVEDNAMNRSANSLGNIFTYLPPPYKKKGCSQKLESYSTFKLRRHVCKNSNAEFFTWMCESVESCDCQCYHHTLYKHGSFLRVRNT